MRTQFFYVLTALIWVSGLEFSELHQLPVSAVSGSAVVATSSISNQAIDFADDNEKSILHGSAAWVAGLADYRKQDMTSAAHHFEAVLKRDDLSASDRAAVAFWAYRAFLAAGDKQRAMDYAARSANEPVSFYSVLARHVTGTTAKQDENEVSSAYPIPHWAPTLGYRVEPALLFAIMRQESRFNPNARSASGATGVMQLMPATAHAMAKTARVAGHSIEPSVSMTLGQSYIEYLMSMSFIGDNLVFVTAAYNAGPGTVANWQRNLHFHDDPLLFVESIPYSETREYVLRVLGNYWVYSELLGGQELTSATALSQGQWPRYDGSDKQLSLMLSRLKVD